MTDQGDRGPGSGVGVRGTGDSRARNPVQQTSRSLLRAGASPCPACCHQSKRRRASLTSRHWAPILSRALRWPRLALGMTGTLGGLRRVSSRHHKTQSHICCAAPTMRLSQGGPINYYVVLRSTMYCSCQNASQTEVSTGRGAYDVRTCTEQQARAPRRLYEYSGPKACDSVLAVHQLYVMVGLSS